MVLTNITKSVEAYHQEWCFGLDKSPQRVEIPRKDVNDFEEFKNHDQMIYAPCEIIADF
ncbi:hypothetical protein C1645_814129 [Glomus cerebriforme]|uniref:Uncharacterized protein n=1 Tax=Glomus cerebriforme TaxID=658196 RepID=A0A397TRB7_9GLOM|nr:hypothetical protein C1645_814129 [Glomus cerebriforme]